MERIAIAIQDGGAGAGARAASQPHFVLPPNLYNKPPGRGDFLVSNFHPGLIPGNWSETISGGEEVLAEKWGGLFLGYLLGKNFWRRIVIISFRPGGWMQQSAVPRCAILSVGSTGGIGQ
jgi:hypothetical protein